MSTNHRPPSATCPACGDVVDYLTEHIAQVGADPRPGGWDEGIDVVEPDVPTDGQADWMYAEDADRAADAYERERGY